MKVGQFLIKVFFFLFIVNSGLAYAEPSNKEVNQLLQQKLGELIHQYNIPGATLTYGFSDEPLQTVSAGMSDIENNTSMQPGTLFVAGSITKSFIGAAILELIQSDKVQANEDLAHIANQYGGELSQILSLYPDLGPVTLKQLLVHISGVPEDINTPTFIQAFIKNPKQVWTDQQLLALAMQHAFYFKPGEPGMWSYTNTDYLLLSIVISSVTKQSDEQILEGLWQKAGLSNIYYANDGVIPHSIANNIAVGYLNIQSNDEMTQAFKNQPVVTIPGEQPYQAYALNNAYNIFGHGSSGIIANTETLALWYRALFQGSLLSKSSIAMMLDGQKNGDYNNAEYGFGVTTHVMPKYGYVISHDGLDPGYSVIVMYFVKYHLVLALATNSTNLNVSTFDVHSGKLMPGLVDKLMPILVNSHA